MYKCTWSDTVFVKLRNSCDCYFFQQLQTTSYITFCSYATVFVISCIFVSTSLDRLSEFNALLLQSFWLLIVNEHFFCQTCLLFESSALIYVIFVPFKVCFDKLLESSTWPRLWKLSYFTRLCSIFLLYQTRHRLLYWSLKENTWYFHNSIDTCESRLCANMFIYNQHWHITTVLWKCQGFSFLKFSQYSCYFLILDAFKHNRDSYVSIGLWKSQAFFLARFSQTDLYLSILILCKCVYIH